MTSNPKSDLQILVIKELERSVSVEVGNKANVEARKSYYTIYKTMKERKKNVENKIL